MVSFAIIEVDDGLTIATIQPGQSAEEAATAQGGVLIDPGPFGTYEEAYDAMMNLGEEEDEEERA